jgi:hypothetical protein
VRSDDKPKPLGDFRRGPALFTVYEQTEGEYPVEVDDGVGPRPCAWISEDSETPSRWQGAWNKDEWCPWIETNARTVIADSSTPAKQESS